MTCDCTFTTTASTDHDPADVEALHDELVRNLRGDAGVAGVADALDHLASGDERVELALPVVDLIDFVAEHQWPDQVATLRLAPSDRAPRPAQRGGPGLT